MYETLYSIQDDNLYKIRYTSTPVDNSVPNCVWVPSNEQTTVGKVHKMEQL